MSCWWLNSLNFFRKQLTISIVIENTQNIQPKIHSSGIFLQISSHMYVQGCSLQYFFCFKIFLYLFYLLLFIFGCIGSSLLGVGFLQLQRAGATLRCRARASHCSGFSYCRAQALSVWASLAVAHGLSSCGSRAQLLRSMQDLPGPGLEPVCPALAGGFLTTAPPGKPQYFFLGSKILETP